MTAGRASSPGFDLSLDRINNDRARPRSSPAPLGSSRPRANTPTPLPTGLRQRTGSAGIRPSRWRREHKAALPQRKSAGSGTYRDPMTARLARFATFAKPRPSAFVPARQREKLRKSLPCPRVRFAVSGSGAAAAFRPDCNPVESGAVGAVADRAYSAHRARLQGAGQAKCNLR